MPELNLPMLARVVVALGALLVVPALAAPPGSDPAAAPAASPPAAAAQEAPAAVPAAPGSAVPAAPGSAVPAAPRSAVPAAPRSAVPAAPRSALPAAPRSNVPAVTDSAAPEAPAPAPAPDASAPAARARPARHASHVHRRAPAAAAASTDATVALTTQPGSELETTATRLVASDLRQSRSAGDPPVMLVGSARLSVKPAPAALFVQVQSADFCGSAGCSTSAYLKNGAEWTKVLDSISGPIKVSRRSHQGMYDLLVHGRDRWVWNGTAYADTLPDPAVDLLHSVRK